MNPKLVKTPRLPMSPLEPHRKTQSGWSGALSPRLMSPNNHEFSEKYNVCGMFRDNSIMTETLKRERQIKNLDRL